MRNNQKNGIWRYVVLLVVLVCLGLGSACGVQSSEITAVAPEQSSANEANDAQKIKDFSGKWYTPEETHEFMAGTYEMKQDGQNISGQFYLNKSDLAIPISGIINGDELSLTYHYDTTDLIAIWFDYDIARQVKPTKAIAELKINSDNEMLGNYYPWVIWRDNGTVSKQADGKTPEALSSSSSTPRELLLTRHLAISGDSVDKN